MKLKAIFFLFFLALSQFSFADDCDCKGNELVYACQNGETIRVNCSALASPMIQCGPCEEADEEPLCAECPANEEGIITLCWIPTIKTNYKTVKGTCDFLEKFFDSKGNLKGKNECGPCKCEMIGDADSDGDGVCDSKDECPNNPDKVKVDSCGCEAEDSDNDGVCDEEDICNGHDDATDSDSDGTPDGCDVCPDNPDYDDEVGPCGCDDQDTDGDGICDSDDCSPNNPDLPTDVNITCDDGNPNTSNDMIIAGSCDCMGQVITCPDADSDGVCDEDDICNGHPDSMDSDSDGTPDGCDICPDNPDYDDEVGPCGCDDQDTDGDGICDSDDCMPRNPQLPTDIDLLCDDGNPNTINDRILAGSCDCIGESVTCADGDSDADGVCDEDDVCDGHSDNLDADNDGTPDGCDVCPDNPDYDDEVGPCGCDDRDYDGDGLCDSEDCMPRNPQLPTNIDLLCDDGNPNTINDRILAGSCDCIGEVVQTCNLCIPSRVMNDYEWINEVSFNAYENESGAGSGYNDYGSTGVSLGHGDSLSIWVFPEYLEDICESSIYIYADWNGDCDFDDADEIIVQHRVAEEAGANIAIPTHSITGEVKFRIILHNGRLRGPCQDYIDGEVEDYSIDVFSRNSATESRSNKLDNNVSHSLTIGPNPVSLDAELTISSANSEIENIKLMNLDGQIVRSYHSNSSAQIIDTHGLSSGLYLLEVEINNQFLTKKIIINK